MTAAERARLAALAAAATPWWTAPSDGTCGRMDEGYESHPCAKPAGHDGECECPDVCCYGTNGPMMTRAEKRDALVRWLAGKLTRKHAMTMGALLCEADALEQFRTAVPALLSALDAAEADRDALIGAGCSPEQNALALLDLYHQREQNALSGEADATRRAEDAELGCEIAYRREPTQAEGDAHAYRAHQGDVLEEAHVPMGNHHGHRCRCGVWVWGGPTTCQRCTDAEAVEIALARAFDAEAERDRLRKRVKLAEARLVAQNRFDGFGHDEDHEAAIKARWAFDGSASKGGE